MSMFKEMMETYQEINTLEGGVDFTKGGFDQLYNEYVKEVKVNRIAENLSVVAGALIGIGSLIMFSEAKRHYQDKD